MGHLRAPLAEIVRCGWKNEKELSGRRLSAWRKLPFALRQCRSRCKATNRHRSRPELRRKTSLKAAGLAFKLCADLSLAMKSMDQDQPDTGRAAAAIARVAHRGRASNAPPAAGIDDVDVATSTGSPPRPAQTPRRQHDGQGGAALGAAATPVARSGIFVESPSIVFRGWSGRPGGDRRARPKVGRAAASVRGQTTCSRGTRARHADHVGPFASAAGQCWSPPTRKSSTSRLLRRNRRSRTGPSTPGAGYTGAPVIGIRSVEWG